MKNNNHAFTLVELLATITILGIVLSITVYVSINAVNRAKENSYKTTKSNIEKIASTYLEENGDRLFYISKNDYTDIEYQCITIENLIDGGYFKNDVLNSQVSKDNKVNKGDYIYVERNSITKSVIKNVYVLNGEDNGVCPDAVKAESNIIFLVSPLEWSKAKEVTITYKLKNANNINDYEYKYNYSNDKIELISDNGDLKKVRVIDNGTLTGIINYLGKEDYSKEIVIDKIDNVGPVISLGSNKKGYVREKTEVYLKVSDFGIGVDDNSFTKDDVVVKVGDKELSQNNLMLMVNSNGSVKLAINNKILDGNVSIQIRAGGVLDKLGNGNDYVELNTGIIFDNTAPSKPEINNPSNGNWINKNISLKLHTVEEGSGVNYWQYTYSDSASSTGTNSSTNWVTYGNSSSVNYTTGEFSQERGQLVYVRACDKVGNCSDKSSTYIKIDKTAPTCSLGVSGTTITATFKDSVSGINGDTTKKATINGANDYTFTTKDNAGNSKSCSVSAKLPTSYNCKRDFDDACPSGYSKSGDKCVKTVTYCVAEACVWGCAAHGVSGYVERVTYDCNKPWEACGFLYRTCYNWESINYTAELIRCESDTEGKDGCYKNEQSTCSSPYSIASTNCSNGYTATSNNAYCYKINANK